MVQTSGGEALYEIVFGETFALYTKAEFLEFLEPFRVRFERNGLSTDMFKGKKCLDAGCGNGRGSLFMLNHGAGHVTCLDISAKNIETTTRFLTGFGYDNFAVQQASLENIPFEDGQFDFVWCNGVIMHANSPNRCLAELARVLGTGGHCWLYIYGSGGVYWRIIQHIRALVRHIPIQACIETLKLLRYETRYIAEFIDDWYASHLRTYTASDLDLRLAELGFEDRQLLKYGMDYDTSHRINTFGDHGLMGEGDLRYLLRKAGQPARADHLLLEGEYGSDYDWPEAITAGIDPAFQKCARLCPSDIARIAFCAHLQRELRLLLTRESPFALEDVLALFGRLEAHLDALKGLPG
jgi:ubiquinone/menaquinone biosynthesis C-methylase UbiE